MATNPMQRKARQSFLLGMVVMLLIAGVVVGFLLYQLMQIKNAEAAIKKVQVCVLSSDVKSGNDVSEVGILKENVYNETTKRTTNQPVSIDSKFAPANAATEADLYGKIAKIDLKAGTIVTTDMLAEPDEQLTDSLRIEELNMLTLPSDLDVGDFVDIRLTLPNGQDFIVVSKKRVLQSTASTISIKMSEEEIVTLSNAIVEAYIVNGSQLRAVKYTDAGIQKSAVPTYTVSSEVLNLIETNGNITTEARNALYTRYKSERRTEINTVVSANMDDYIQKVQDGFEQQNRKAQEERNKYIELLGGESL